MISLTSTQKTFLIINYFKKNFCAIKNDKITGYRNFTLPRISLRRKFAELTVNKFQVNRVMVLGPDLACLEWLMNCGATSVKMSNGTIISTQKQMKNFLKDICGYNLLQKLKASTTEFSNDYKLYKLQRSFTKNGTLVAKQWSKVLPYFIEEVDASDAVISDEGFQYFFDCRQIKRLKMNFCDYFSDLALCELSYGQLSRTLIDLEIVMNPRLTDAATFWLVKLKSLKRAHFYFLPYVSQRDIMLRKLRIELPNCHVTFPPTNIVGFGYEEANKY